MNRDEKVAFARGAVTLICGAALTFGITYAFGWWGVGGLAAMVIVGVVADRWWLRAAMRGM